MTARVMSDQSKRAANHIVDNVTLADHRREIATVDSDACVAVCRGQLNGWHTASDHVTSQNDITGEIARHALITISDHLCIGELDHLAIRSPRSRIAFVDDAMRHSDLRALNRLEIDVVALFIPLLSLRIRLDPLRTLFFIELDPDLAIRLHATKITQITHKIESRLSDRTCKHCHFLRELFANFELRFAILLA